MHGGKKRSYGDTIESYGGDQKRNVNQYHIEK